MSAVVDAQYFCVKFPILSHLTDYEIMESVANIIQPQYVTALIPNHEEALVGVYLNNLESFCLLLQGGITVQGYHMCSLPLIGAYTASNVFPMVSNDALTELFQNYGDIIEVQYVKSFPNNEVYDHIINNKRRLYFRLPRQNSTVCVPVNVKANIENVSLNINIEQHCLVCASDGHDVLRCADLKDFMFGTEILDSFCAEPAIDTNTSHAVQLTTNQNINETSLEQKHVTEKINHNSAKFLKNIVIDENDKSNFECELPSVHINQNASSITKNFLEGEKENDLEQNIPVIPNENAANQSKTCLERGKEHDLEPQILGIQISVNSPTEKVDTSKISPCMPDIVNSQLFISPENKCLASNGNDMPILNSPYSFLTV